jgi:hypothetical protein
MEFIPSQTVSCGLRMGMTIVVRFLVSVVKNLLDPYMCIAEFTSQVE